MCMIYFYYIISKYDLDVNTIQNLIEETKNINIIQNQATTMKNKPISNQGQQNFLFKQREN